MLRIAFAALAAVSLLCVSTVNAQVKPRMVVAFDTSGSMLLNLAGDPTYGDGVLEGCSQSNTNLGHPYCGATCTAGIDTNCDGLPNDSRIFIAKEAVSNMVNAFGDVDWSLARFRQAQAVDAYCSIYPGGSCPSIFNSFGNPQCFNGGSFANCNTPAIPGACLPGTGGRPSLEDHANNDDVPCINYDGTCTGGGDFLVDFPNVGAFANQENSNAILKWLDNSEPNPILTNTSNGNFCNHLGAGNCELRANGSTPLGGILNSVFASISPTIANDPAAGCRPYSVVLITDGAESCGGDAVAAATTLLGMGVTTRVVGLAISAGAATSLNAIANAGGSGQALFANNPTELAAALAVVVNESLLVETCNNLDDDCDGVTDEGFQKYCDRDNVLGQGATSQLLRCTRPADDCDNSDDNCSQGTTDEPTNACGVCGPPPVEVCNGLDDNCNGAIDEGNVCAGCVPAAEICDGQDNDCDGSTDESLTRGCGTSVGECSPGTEVCSNGNWGACSGQGPVPETCDGLDNDCDGAIDGNTRPCGSSVGACQPGNQVCTNGSFGTCVGAVGPRSELCDGIDNNCNGSTDESNPGGGGACGTSIGRCTRGSFACVGGSLVCQGGTGPVAETCNNQDDDCDGNIDEAVPTAGACGSSTGECRPGVRTCVNGAFQCVGGRGPVNEICDGLDNNCNGSTDESNPGGGAQCGTDTGICSLGTTRCVNGALVCQGGTSGSMELCDTLDNDCDGLVDEGNPQGGGTCGATDEGECERGALVCVAGALACVGEQGPAPEICDGLDNDCDATTDEGNPEGGEMCGDSTGECMGGTTQCTNGMLVCQGGVGPTPEICDGLDNDCDGVPDEGLGVGAPCGTGIGECVPGQNICRNGALVCEGESAPGEEVCDGLDNDCDGPVDEGIPVGAECGTSEGICEPGGLQCVDGVSVCVGSVPPAPEACDCDDNDCDGTIDEAENGVGLCPAGSACVDCGCSLPCKETEFGVDCPSGKTPKMENNECFCVAERCNADACATESVTREDDTLCAPDADGVTNCVCKNNECTFSCDGVVCADGTVCDPRDPAGRCVEDSCRGLGCATGELCDAATGACEPDPCVNVTCQDGEACRDGECEASCAGVECPQDQVCSAGECVADPCATVSCGAGQVCNPEDATCVDDACEDVTCPDGRDCDPVTGTCLEDPCSGLSCPDEQVCVEGECQEVVTMPDAGPDAGDAGVDTGTRVRDRVIATGAGGCACDVTQSTPKTTSSAPWLALMFLILVGWRRRTFAKVFSGKVLSKSLRRTLKQALLTIAGSSFLLLGSACNVDPYCLNCEDGAVDATGDAAPDADDGGVPDAIPDATPDAIPDAFPDGCTADGQEFCNDNDDDCDGLVDEGVDTQSDVNNCGGCGIACAPRQAFGECNAGVCSLGSCDVGWFDLNGLLDDGCEYRCLVTADNDELCDLRDNDCDGDVDEDVALETDPMNCGSCGRICRFAHVTTPQCSAAACVFTGNDCEENFFDINGVVDDGCEYSCTPSGAEVCDNQDNDCDGMFDEGDPGGGAQCGTDVGLCSRGVEKCIDGAVVCDGAVTPATEACNGMDDDCDSDVDESNPDGGRLCGQSVGSCQLGRETCISGALACVGTVDPVAEVCDGLDNDCDNQIDEGNPQGGAACGETTGACSAGTQSCRGGVLVCEGAVGPSLETCNNSDDDCDGSVDENNPGGGGSCGTDVGACLPGTRSCVNGALQCVGSTSGSAETCNNQDDDCDGSVDENNPGGGAACGSTVGACSAGSNVCLGGTLVCQGATGASTETCNDSDDDCDGSTDEDFLLQTDVNNCGQCGRNCAFANAVAGCTGGSCRITNCLSGFVNLDNLSVNGCEYACSFNGAEICNGVDDDCDGSTDEGLTAPSNFCNPNGVCAGTSATCGGASGWECNYGGNFEESEQSCDGLDNDCDGMVDEPFPLKNQPCSNGIGLCRRTGTFQCAAAGDAVVCNAAAAGMGSAETCNGIDDDCDGTTDENIGGSIPVVTVPRSSGGGTVDIMRYEASRPDATASMVGENSAVACSKQNVLPWTTVTWPEASAACSAIGAGWQLCESADWQGACEGMAGTCDWSYANNCTSSQPTRCNGDEYDSSGAAGDQDQLFTTGSPTFPQCYANWGSTANRVFDMSGNVKEWTNTAPSPNVHEIRGGSYNNVETGRTCSFDFTVGDNSFRFPNTGFRCCRY